MSAHYSLASGKFMKWREENKIPDYGVPLMKIQLVLKAHIAQIKVFPLFSVHLQFFLSKNVWIKTEIWGK